MKGLCWCFVTCVFFGFLRSGNALTCLNCDAVSNPRLCTHVTQCYPGEKCGVETFISPDGDLRYKLGCVDKNTCSTHAPNTTSGGYQYFSCNSCCDSGDLCNAYGCNNSGFPINRGPICYNCEALPKGYPCHRIAHCETHEVCFNDAHLEFQTDELYSSGCRSRHQCANEAVDPETFVGKRTASICTDCCKGDLCNVQCSQTSVCFDDPSCKLLMSSYDVCKSPEVANKFCRKSCNLCPTSAMTSCVNTRLDCANIGSAINLCGTKQTAEKYGCLQYCGYCSGTTMGLTKTTMGPIMTTKGPIMTTKGHIITTKGPIITTNIPIITTKRPIITTKGPIITTKGPIITTKGPIITTKGPPRTTTVPTTSLSTKRTFPTSTVRTTAAHTTRAMPVLHIGDHVIRGPDWQHGDQDANSTGVVTKFTPSRGTVNVKWNKSNGTVIKEYQYYYGEFGKYEVKLVARATAATVSGYTTTPPTTTPTAATTPLFGQSTTPQSTRLLVKGDYVVRGPDWAWGNQDGNTTGVVTGSSVPGWVTVRWGYGFENSYRYGSGGKYDVTPVNKGYTSGATSGTVKPGVINVGEQVIRGPDWTYNNQDGNSTGTVVAVDNQSRGPWVKVHWNDGTENFYRFGVGGKYDVIKFVVTTTTMLPKTTAIMKSVQVGDRVVRGPDWMWGNQDSGGTGTVISVSTPGWVTVKWDNNFTNSYRYGVLNKHDIQKVGLLATTTPPPARATTAPPTAGTVLANDMYIGARVQRGVHWRYGDQEIKFLISCVARGFSFLKDGHGYGTVRQLPPKVPPGWVTVEWDNGYVNNYRLGAEESYDVMFVPGTYNPPAG